MHLWIWAPVRRLHTYKTDHRNLFTATRETAQSSRCLEEQSDSIQKHGGIFQVLQFREGRWRRRSCCGSEGQSHFKMTWEGEKERKKHLRGGEERRGEKGSLCDSDVNYSSPSFAASENKRKHGHGEKRGQEREHKKTPTGILFIWTHAKTGQTKAAIIAKEDVKWCNRAAFDKCWNAFAIIVAAVDIM